VAYIIIETDTDEGTWTLKERVTPEDMRSDFFCNRLVERLRWAVADVDSQASQKIAADEASPQRRSIRAASELS
jgi:hypothetical protein